MHLDFAPWTLAPLTACTLDSLAKTMLGQILTCQTLLGQLLVDFKTAGVSPGLVGTWPLLFSASSSGVLESVLQWVINVLQVIFGIGMVIFVHELGHFLVAKWCGVRCDKFYLGFDINGWKLYSFQWGETEYGIGAIPLGGYVKMLGQEDDPRAMREEMERARLQQTAGENTASENIASENTGSQAIAASQQAADQSQQAVQPLQADQPESQQQQSQPASGEEVDGPIEYDPRSFLAKSVYQRMAIISAGVVMNVIFAFLIFAVAYFVGVKYHPSIASAVSPGSPAWKAGMEPGDRIQAIGTREDPRFRQLQVTVMLSDYGEAGIPLEVYRPRTNETFNHRLVPVKKDDQYLIGIASPLDLQLQAETPAIPNTSADQVTDQLLSVATERGGGRITQVNGEPVKNYSEYYWQLLNHVDQTITLTVEPSPGAPTGDSAAQPVEVQLAPNPLKRLGLIMSKPQIDHIRDDSPASQADLRQGDRILAVDGQPVDDPMTLPYTLWRLAGQKVDLKIQRGDDEKTVTLVPEKLAPFFSRFPNETMELPALGLTYTVQPTVVGILPEDQLPSQESASSRALNQLRKELKERGNLTLAKATIQWKAGEKQQEQTFSFEGKDAVTWMSLFTFLQEFGDGMQVKLTFAKLDEPVTLETYPSADGHNLPQRGMVLTGLSQIRQTGSLTEALAWSADDVVLTLAETYQFLRRILTGELSTKFIGGPIRIAAAASITAARGWGEFLFFIGIISINLAVVNFLPIPILDGGHIVFLIYEAVRGRPANEAWQVGLQALGLCLILGLMLFVIVQDSLWLWQWNFG